MFQPPPLLYQVSPFNAKVPMFTTVDDADRRARSSRSVGLIFLTEAKGGPHFNGTYNPLKGAPIGGVKRCERFTPDIITIIDN